MSFWDTAEEDPLTELIQNPNAPLCDVLLEGTMLQELRAGNADLISYLTQERIINELCQWSMTMDFEKRDGFDKLSRIATETLTCGGNFQKELLNSTALKNFFTNFMSSTKEWDSICTGHLQRVFVNLLKNSNGNYLSNFPNIAEDLDSHLTILAVAELIVLLATEFNASLPKQYVPILAKYIETSKTDLFPAVYALRQIYNNGSTIPAIAESFTNEEVISSIVKTAHTSQDKLTSIELYRLLSKIKEQSPLAAGLILKYSDQFGHPEKSVENSIAAFSAAEIDTKTAATILCTNTHWGIANKLTAKLAAAPQAELVEVVNKSGLFERIVENSKNGCLTAQQIEVIRLMSKAGADLSAVQKSDVEKALLLGVRYGGEVPIGFQAEHKINAE
ncbi:hypothetical protein TRFO_34312 [Tritrichomonas foetus]|uniref:Uncharacterized protein n=1 Tax=Tritrichomonas foetus TaxID=1144522 RepID=A0A1J4JJE6_9EUKA|nr:hypothetical protein TRFO_34312 [Tritrichomonas foetus]|eukprot:OHS99282.1 hypothetical protein TRFO_34312 [Tritrichomonas foetus]